MGADVGEVRDESALVILWFLSFAYRDVIVTAHIKTTRMVVTAKQIQRVVPALPVVEAAAVAAPLDDS